MSERRQRYLRGASEYGRAAPPEQSAYWMLAPARRHGYTMVMELPNAPGTYVLILHLPVERRLVVGRLGEIAFAPGFYAYVGSALGRTGCGLRQRLTRHLRRNKRLHWHIDTLREVCEIVEIWYVVGSERYECTWAAALGALPELSPVTAAFDASDCACRTHLFLAANPPDAEVFGRAVKQLVTRLAI